MQNKNCQEVNINISFSIIFFKYLDTFKIIKILVVNYYLKQFKNFNYRGSH